MVVVSNEILSEKCKEDMNSTCALGPTQRHKLFGGGILKIDPWCQTKEGSMQVKTENTSPINKNTNSPTYSTSTESNTINMSPNTVYNTLHRRQNQMQIKEGSNNNNSNEEDSSQLDMNSIGDTQNQQQGSDDSQSSMYTTGSDNGSVRPPSNGPTYLTDGSIDGPLRCLQMALQRTGMMGTPPPNKSSVIMPNHHQNTEKPLQCPICAFSTTSRVNFNTHLRSHEDKKTCNMCNFTAKCTDQFKKHMRDKHDVILSGNGDNDALNEEEPGLTVPKINSQGKVKILKCKQCDFSAYTKLDYWEHTKTHIKQERLLTCPKCPFVTEYKHHLEYHLRNHFGSKPFKCQKCSYSCVNKSMLNSHLKSHSNVYQYHCTDCTYATKYCHSLKLHLRKYGHTPAMVLHPDGSPNPLPIVDVYGTRRGPKQKTTKTTITDENNSQSVNRGTGFNSIHPLLAPPYAPYYTQLLQPYVYQTGNAIIQQDSYNPQTSQQQDKQSGNNFYQTKNNNLYNNVNDNSSEQFNEETMENGSSPEREEEKKTTEDMDQLCKAPLDLSRSDSQEASKIETNNYPSVKTHAGNHGNGTVKVSERRRKGKAFRLDTIALRLQQQNSSSDEGEFDCEPLLKKRHVEKNYIEENNNNSNNNNNNHNHSNNFANDGELPLQCVLDEEYENDDDKKKNEDHPNSPSPSTSSTSSSSSSSSLSLMKKRKSLAVKDLWYSCLPCQMKFKNEVMYEIHKGYHGYKDPFQCNICGLQTADKISFYLHITQVAH